MDWTPDWSLRLRMVLAVSLLALVAAAFVAVAVGALAALAFAVDLPVIVAPVGAVGALVGIAALELRQDARVTAEASAAVVEAEQAPRFHRIATAVAQQADLPVPTLALVEADAPEAFTVGYRPSTTTLVVSTGLLDCLGNGELRAVVAHELAHVKNRDVAVMTAASLPVAIAQRLRGWADDEGTVYRGRYRPPDGSDGPFGGIPAFVVSLVAGIFSLIGRLLVASFSRARELAADRGAAAITGEPAAMASALATIEAELDEGGVATEDLRARRSVAAFSVVSPQSTAGHDGPVRLGPEGERAATLHYHSRRLDAVLDRYLHTHPPVSVRREHLADLQRKFTR